MNKIIKIITLVLLSLTGVNAIIAGALFIIDPTGQKMGMSVDYLSTSPFENFMIPGITLFTINGLMNLAAAIYVFKDGKYSVFWAMLQGILLCGWIVVQVIMVQDLNILHIIMFSIGSILVGITMIGARKIG